MASPQSDPARDPLDDPRNPEHLKIGTLTYTKAGLASLFLFLLWGDFCFCLMETVVPSIMPLELNKLGASNWTIGLILSTIPNLMTAVVNPVVSFRSDRFRSRWGRRIPFLAGATPFLVIFLILLGYSEPISRFVHHAILGGKGSDLSVLLMVVGGFTICFQFFNLFITSIYYYLFNDVVPRAFLARMTSLARIVATCAGSVYQYFIFQYSDGHMPEIFLGAALLYLFAFGLMCWKVKEGDYAPPPPNLGNQAGLLGSIKTYAAECYTHRFYWLFFLANSFAAMTWVSGPFNQLLSMKVLGYDRAFIGHVAGVTGILSMALLYPAGILADRFHPLRVIRVGLAISLLMVPPGIAFVFLRPRFSLHAAEMITIALSVINVPIGALLAASDQPLWMKLLPRDRYGQFSSANALVRSIALILGGIACGYYLDYMKRFGADPDACYRFLPFWNLLFNSGYLVFICLLYREWKRMGGLTGYVPPTVQPPAALAGILGTPSGK